ncbi:PREDICTED: coiled-coil domain-containing protein 180 [Apaloderma vittatum]|uniref:coiled-coil domain-containing protein 180 n=1 Tax=Apaloderma vittatum TaxID=57397 RepID=UPI0005212B3D|nr:PREDICTED: coiled-coil domain-containing protein 180 [Apaloderma vittatum]
MPQVGAVRLVPRGKVYKQIFEAEVQLVRSLDEVRKSRFSVKNEGLGLTRDSEISADAKLLPCYQEKYVAGTPCSDSAATPLLYREATISQKVWKSEDVNAAEEVRGLPDFDAVPEETRISILEGLSERRRGRHDEALTSLYHELACIGRGLEELWNAIHQESLTRRKWIREMDESLKKIESSRADKITDVLRKYTLILEEISFFLPADVYRFMNDEAMMINRALLANQRAIAKLFFNLMKSEMKRELSYQLKWQDRVKDWKLIRKNSVVHSFSDLLPPTHTKADMSEWYRSLVNLNKSIDTHNVQRMVKIRIQYELVQQKCMAEVQRCTVSVVALPVLGRIVGNSSSLLNLNICTKEEAEEIVNSELLQLTEKLKSRFEEELKQMDRDFEELAKQNEQSCRDLYSYFQEAMDLWDVHRSKLSQQEGELQKKLGECRQKQDNSIQMMETKLDVILDKMRTESSEEKMKKYLENALSSLDGIRARYEKLNKVLMDEVEAYPEAILLELVSYSRSISEYFNVKEIFKQNLQGEIDFAFRDQELREASEAECQQQAESVVQDSEGEETANSCQQENEETNRAENKEIFAHETEGKEDGESIVHESQEREHAEQGAMCKSSNAERSEIATETFSTSSGNTYTVLGIEEAGKTDIPETYFAKYEKKESLPLYLKYVLIKETMVVELKKRIRLYFFEHLEKWFAESLSNSSVFVDAKKEELNSELQLRLRLHQQRQENIEKNIYNVRAVELSLHKEHLECHCAGLVEAMKKERAEFLKFCDQQDNLSKNLHSRLRDIESVFLSAPMTKLFSEGGNFSPPEVKSFSKRLQKESKHIDSFERSIKTDMEKMESSCLKQATELINEAEKKFHYLLTNRTFMEKIQRFLSNLRVKINSEVANSNFQAATLNSYLEQLHQKIDACTHPTADKEAVSSEELYDFAKVVLKELKKRSQYLDCLLVKAASPQEDEDFTPLATDVTLQGPVAVAIRTERCRDDNKIMMIGLDPVKFPLLNPSRRGKSPLDDLSISVIKNLLEKKKSITPVFSDQKFQIFGEKPPESEPNRDLFELSVTFLFYLDLLKEFYKKQKPKIIVPEDLPETFEHCAEVFRQNLLSYQRQTDDYYNSCLIEFQDQLKLFEKELPYVSQLALEGLLKEHEQKLSYSTGQIWHLFNKQLEDWENVKAAHQNQLHPSLGHPDNFLQLDALCQEEIKRQKDQVDGINLNIQMLQNCAAECSQNFVSALAALTEKLLLELDGSITIDDVQAAKTEIPKEKTSPLIHRKQAGLHLETCEAEQLIERGGRTWPGIPMTTLSDSSDYILCRETASVTTAKTTLGHVAAVEARDAVYKKYKCKLEQQFAQIKEESAAQLLTARHWEDWWQRSIQKIKQLYTRDQPNLADVPPIIAGID